MTIPLFIFLNFRSKDIKEACCKDVLIYIAEELDKDWHQFLMILTNNRNLKINEKSGKENILNYFESIAFQLSWTDLRSTLHDMEKLSIVNYIEKNFPYTRGMRLCSLKIFDNLCYE